jgi:redox-sensing transcriptional repressor
LAYRGFDAKGFRLVAVFDNDASKLGKKFGPFTVQALSELEATVKDKSIRLAMIAVPADFAQTVADQLLEAGVRGLLNFAPVSLTVPGDVALNSVDLAVSLEQLSFQVNVSLPHVGQTI